MSDDTSGRTSDPRGKVFSIGFLALVATQFFVALNDNMFRWLINPIGKELLTDRWHDMPEFVQKRMQPDPLALALSLGLFTLPFLVFAAPAGYLADRFSKRSVMVTFKAVEIVVIGFGIAAICLGNILLMFCALFILGIQAMMYGTAKLGAIPEIVRSDTISAANGLINMGSMGAMIIGTIAGNWLYSQTKPAGQKHAWIFASALLGVAICGFVTSLFIDRLRPANPARPIPWNPVGQIFRDIRTLAVKRSLLWVALGSSYFWTLAGLLNLNIDQFATKHLHAQQSLVGPLLASLTLGIGAGAALAGWASRGKVELGLVPFGGLGIAVGSCLLGLVPHDSADPWSGYGVSCALLAMMGMAAGFYDIPLQAFLQARSPPESRGSIMAAYNFLSFGGIMLGALCYWTLSNPLGLSSQEIFLVCSAATGVVTLAIVWSLPFDTTRLLLRLLVHSLYRVRLEGIENVPAGGALLAANHVSWVDGLLLGLSSPRHPRMVAFAKYFDNRWLGWFGRLGRIIPISDSRKSMVESIRAARAALQQGELVGIFPEGNITRTGKIEEFRPGFLSILKGTGVPVVPVYVGGLWGSVFSYEGGRFFWKRPRCRRRRVTIRFGPPIHQPADAEQVQRAVAELGGEVASG
jgi:acyl-[acyl-carrier-protein]-phospholipid O-acyltransferase / long-chain-fatty-acid--[acyl-carrier-protein] ligase